MSMDQMKYGITKQRVESTFLFLFGLFIVLSLLLRGRLIQPTWMAAGFLLTAVFFYVLHITERRTASLSNRNFFKKLFLYSLISRLLAVIILVIIAEITWGLPSYVGAVDAVRYLNSARELSDVIWKLGPSHVGRYLVGEFGRDVDGAGICVVLGTLFALTFKSVILAKLVIALIGSCSVLLVYRTASLLTDQSTARLAGLMAAFLPVSLFYDAVILKESFVVFLTSLVIFLFTAMVVQGRFTLKRMGALIACLAGLFFFRVAAGAVIVVILSTSFVINRIKGSPVFSWTVGLTAMVAFTLIIIASGQSDFFVEKVDRGVGLRDRRLSAIEQGSAWKSPSSIERKTTWRSLSTTGPVFLVLSHFAPFPSLIRHTAIDRSTFYGHNSKYYEIAGLIAWNILATFALFGLWHLLRNNLKHSMMVWGYTVGYSLVLGFTAMFTQSRLGWNVLPMMMIPAAVGIMNYRKIEVFYLALAGAGLVIIAWNVFRAAGRGLL
jgi:hypothetical protein